MLSTAHGEAECAVRQAVRTVLVEKSCDGIPSFCNRIHRSESSETPTSLRAFDLKPNSVGKTYLGPSDALGVICLLRCRNQPGLPFG